MPAYTFDVCANTDLEHNNFKQYILMSTSDHSCLVHESTTIETRMLRCRLGLKSRRAKFRCVSSFGVIMFLCTERTNKLRLYFVNL